MLLAVVTNLDELERVLLINGFEPKAAARKVAEMLLTEKGIDPYGRFTTIEKGPKP